MERVIFLDIDGVLLPGSAWLAPDNDGPARLLAGAQSREELTAAAAAVRFDRVAVLLLNRLCWATGAQIVVSSDWRHSVDVDLRQKLLAEGVEEQYLHHDLLCPKKLTATKSQEIGLWLRSHDGAGGIVIDDDVLEGCPVPQVLTGYDRGLDVEVYRRALALLEEGR